MVTGDLHWVYHYSAENRREKRYIFGMLLPPGCGNTVLPYLAIVLLQVLICYVSQTMELKETDSYS